MMANDCPHRKQLESTLRACHDHTEVINKTRDNCLNIIDEFKHDLDELTAEVAKCTVKGEMEQKQVQELLSQPSSKAVTIATNGLEAAMLALAEHNELLKLALLEKSDIVASTQQTTDARIYELQNYSSDLCEHIQCLKDELRDRDVQIDKLNNEMARQAAGLEKSKLQELTKLKEENCEQARCIHSLTTVLNSEKQIRREIHTKFVALDNCCAEVNEQLRAANNRAASLQDHFQCMQQKFEESKIECKLLRDELICLKEKESLLLGRERSMGQQMKQSESELEKARKLICNMQQAIDQNDREHCIIKQKLRQAENDNTQQLCQLKKDICQLQADLHQQLSVNVHKEKILNSFRKWQEDQRESDEHTRVAIRNTEEHIQMLMEDNRQYIEENRELLRDIQAQECEIQRLKTCGMSGNRQVGGVSSGEIAANNDAAEARLDCLQSTAQRAAEHRRSLRSSSPTKRADLKKINGNDEGNTKKARR